MEREVLEDLVDRREAIRRTAILLGGAVSASTVAGVLAGCGDAAAATSIPRVPWKPRAMTAAQAQTVASIADHIIPPTDTPGAVDAGVHRFIDTMLAEYYTPPQRDRLLEGVADIDARAKTAHGKTFVRCTKPQQRAVLEAIDAEAFAAASKTVATDPSKETERGGGGTAVSSTPAEVKRHYFRTMKELVIVGYYTSQAGATKELRYVQVPGRFQGCVPMKSIGRTWAV